MILEESLIRFLVPSELGTLCYNKYMQTSQKILDYIKKNTQASGKELADYLGNISSRAVRKQLRNFLDNGVLRKIGRPPKVYYLLAGKKRTPALFSVDKKTLNI